MDTNIIKQRLNETIEQVRILLEILDLDGYYVEADFAGDSATMNDFLNAIKEKANEEIKKEAEA